MRETLAADAPYKNLKIVIDTREKSKERINHLKEWFFERGGTVQMGTVKYCDYHIMGGFRGKYIDLGLEFKALDDFCTSYHELHERFANTCIEYQNVALFIEGRISLQLSDVTGKYYVKNHIGLVGKEGEEVNLAEICPLMVYHHNIHEFERLGIHVSQFDFIYMFGPYLDALLNYLTNYPFSGVRLKKEDPRKAWYSMYAQIDGFGPKSCDKIADASPGYWLDNPDELRTRLGKETTKKLLNMIKARKLENGTCSRNV